MKILLISAFPPSKHNLGGPSALPYYLAKHKPEECEIDLVYYEGYEKYENLFLSDLGEVFKNVYKLPKTIDKKYYPQRLIQLLNIYKGLEGANLRYLPAAGFNNKIDYSSYDLAWIYPHTLQPWVKKFNKKKILVTGPDCSFLHYSIMSQVYQPGKLDYSGEMLNNATVTNITKLKKQALAIDKRWSNSNALIHVVGEDDKIMYENLGATNNCFFSPHPFYEYSPIQNSLTQTIGKLTVLVSGVNHSVYIGNFLDRIVNLLTKHPHLNTVYKFLFIGKGFEEAYQKLKNVGFAATLQTWVDSYEDEIATANIQLFPIIVGTGTKGKVLCALSTGLLSIGTKYAFENIAINESEDYVLINDETDVIVALDNIAKDKSKYQLIAKSATNKVRELHSPKFTADIFWNKVINYNFMFIFLVLITKILQNNLL